ncbi:MAG: RlmE family RNA methyltransferase [Bdellovibrio sp.]|nr:RlmE family RNA methyltransferase [Bdellovibrio sp.]
MTFKVKDYYYKKAKKENYLARSIYKLEEIDARYKILKKGALVLDLGYYPGSWIQYTSAQIGDEGRIIGIDLQDINAKLSNLRNVTLFKADFFELKELNAIGLDRRVDVLLSDMAPNTTGVKSVDQVRSLNLVEGIFELLPTFLKPQGKLVIKLFESQMAQDFLRKQKPLFDQFHFLRPQGTRAVSKEYYVIGLGYKRPKNKLSI